MGTVKCTRVVDVMMIVVRVVVVVCFCTQSEARTTDQQIDKNCVIVDNDPAKIICVCDEHSCDRLSFKWPQTPGELSLIETTQAGSRFKVTNLDSFNASQSESNLTNGASPPVVVRLEAKRQTILGWGGAFTDSATINIRQLRPALIEELLQSYYGADGLSYNFGRVPIGGSDFSVRPYSYDDSPEPDYNLTHWSLTNEDLKYKIPTIQRAMQIVNLTGERLKLFASPWSPPKWMKSNHEFARGYLLDEGRVFASYAAYLMKFYDAYREMGIEFWGATVQNEPISAYLPHYFFNSLQMSNSQAIKFIGEHLGPALESRGLTKDNFKLMVGDDSLGFLNFQVPQIMQDRGVQKYVSGLAFHWYTSGLIVPYDMLSRVLDETGGHFEFVLMSEACEGSMPGAKKVDLGSWDRGEAYAADIMEDLKRETGGWIDWNLALDEQGGPNWAKNFVDSPIIVHKSGSKFFKQPMYYALAHFSRFFRPGSVYTKVEPLGRSLNRLTFAAVQNEETGHLVVNVLNRDRSAKRLSLVVEDRGNVRYRVKAVELQPKSVNTIVLKL